MAAVFSLQEFGAALAALSGLSTAAFGLLDATKVFGGIARVGLKHLKAATDPFAGALNQALGNGRYEALIDAKWMNGASRDEQKALIRALIRLGLTESTAPSLAEVGRVAPEALARVARKLANGEELEEADLNLLGRLNAVIDTILETGFERADQQYRNTARVWAGVIAIGLALAAWGVWVLQDASSAPTLLAALGMGVLAVPLAPLAKDLTSGLSAAMQALKAAKGS